MSQEKSQMPLVIRFGCVLMVLSAYIYMRSELLQSTINSDLVVSFFACLSREAHFLLCSVESI